MSLTSVLKLIAGIGLFLYGMDLMGDGLKLLAGASLEKILEKLTKSRFKGLALGTVVTALIQSSAATCIMCLGFINAGIMNLYQAIPVAFGANIGSTITGQILRLGDISEGSLFLTMLKPSSFSSLLIAYGVVVLVFLNSRKKKMNSIAMVMLGLGILFFGMSTMETTISPLKDNPAFQSLFTMFTNPILGVLLGTLVTAVIQSSSASVGILQALTATGIVTWRLAIPIILGQNIGKCFTVFLGSINASKDSKRLAFVHFFFNLFGAIFIGCLIYAFNGVVNLFDMDATVSRGNIADFHSLFNIITALILVPFSTQIGKLSQFLIRDKKEAVNEHHRVDQLDDLLLKTPIVALDTARKVTIQMGYAAMENFDIVTNLIQNYSEDKIPVMEENERFMDQAESKVSDYLVKINTAGTYANLETNEILRSVSDFERIGDYCINIYDMVQYNRENDLSFSPACLKEMEAMNSAIRTILQLTVEAFEHHDTTVASRVEPLEEVVDSMKEMMSARHIERLRNNLCSVQAGISLVEYLNSVERISDHCSNIAIHTIRSRSSKSDFDTHSYLSNQHEGVSDEYKELYLYYQNEFLDPMSQIPTVEDELAEKRSREAAAAIEKAKQLEAADQAREAAAGGSSDVNNADNTAAISNASSTPEEPVPSDKKKKKDEKSKSEKSKSDDKKKKKKK